MLHHIHAFVCCTTQTVRKERIWVNVQNWKSLATVSDVHLETNMTMTEAEKGRTGTDILCPKLIVS